MADEARALGECDETFAGEISFPKWLTGKGEFTGSWLEQQSDFSVNLPKRDVTQNQTIVPLRSTARQLVGWADTASPELPDQLGTAVHAKLHGGARRAHQFADLKLTFLSTPPEELRFVIHTDYSSRDQDGTTLERPTRQWERDTWHRGHHWFGRRTS